MKYFTIPTIKESHDFPPNWEELVRVFGVKWGDVVVTYGDTCYCKKPLTPDLTIHESLHMEQQKAYPGGVTAWWKEY
ncbi:hypothetical protein, partial [Staphylococcus aureus]